MGELVAAYPKQVVLGCLYSGVTTPFVKPVGASAFPHFLKTVTLWKMSAKQSV